VAMTGAAPYALGVGTFISCSFTYATA
jgi:hypothetical protein